MGSQGRRRSQCVLGIDFTSAPSRQKPITVAVGTSDGQRVRLLELHHLNNFEAFEQLLQPRSLPEAWVGGFDFPFGLPRTFVHALEDSSRIESASALIDRTRGPDPANAKRFFQTLVDGWGRTWGMGSRPEKLPHRRTDLASPYITSTSPLQTRYVPVGKMYVEGFGRLIDHLHIDIPILRPAAHPYGHALEAYPGLLAAEILQGQGTTASYKNDPPDDRQGIRKVNRSLLLDRLSAGSTRLSVQLELTTAQHAHLVEDPLGDRLDAVLCMVQATWGARQHQEGHAHFGLPSHTDPLEGWILTA